MTAPIHSAMILGAGLGLRMRPLSLVTPKPLIEIGGRPIIDRLIDKLIAAKIARVVVNIHWLPSKMRAHLAGRTDIEIVISDETEELLDSGGGVYKALDALGPDPFLVLNGDSLWVDTLHPALGRMINSFDPARMDCLMLMAATIRSIGYEGAGDYMMAADGQLTRRNPLIQAPFVYCGAHILSPAQFVDLPGPKFSLNRLWDRAQEAWRLYGLRHDGAWLHAGTPDALVDIETFLKKL
jgi:MurNAc alpha-1-phosphate uridylyltransferase